MSETTADSPYRTVKEVAAYYRVSTKTVSRWLAAGLPGLNVGSAKRPDHRIRLEDVDKWLRERQT